MLRRDIITLSKIIDEINVAVTMMGETDFESFDADEMKKRAVCMTAINIGELVKNLSSECRADNNEIPWKLIAGFRDIAAHKYGSLRMEDVYTTVVNDFPVLKEQISEVLNAKGNEKKINHEEE
ncbi:MAG: DUF86 domain-containing protein [Clostridia bacterium]|nr:DUF86 domain-containing protein [Clostridia bacterium]